jgi:membrane protease YdiL (CAAX protease family)
VSSVYILTRDPAVLAAPSLALLLGFIFWTIVPFLILPLGYVTLRQGWTLPGLGVRKPTSRRMVVFGLALFGLAGLLPALGGGSPMPWSLLVIALYQPAFIEEFFFRVILQGKLERALGPTRAWIWSGLLFGLAHVPADFFGPQFYSNGESYLNASFLLLSQIISGWIFGLIYAKTRSIFPGFIAHFMTDSRLGSIVLHLLPV